MALGGPFSFLAGLGLLGAAGVKALAEDGAQRMESIERSKHNYLPDIIQNELENYVHINLSGYQFSCFGYKTGPMIEAIQDELFISYELAEKIFIEGMAKIGVEMLGYEFNYNDTKFKVSNSDINQLPKFFRDEFKIKNYNEILAAKSPEEYRALNCYFTEGWDSFYWPYTFSMKYVQRGELPPINYTNKLGALEKEYIRNGQLRRMF